MILAKSQKKAKITYEPLEVTPRKFEEMHGVPFNTVVELCIIGEKNGGYPCRKITAKGQLKNEDDKGTWLVNLVRLRENLQ